MLFNTDMTLLQIIMGLTCVIAITNAAPVEHVVPSEIANCINRLTPVVNTTDANKVPGLGTPQDVYLYCLQQFVWRADMVRWEDYDITKKDKDFINGLLASMMNSTGETNSRNKRGVTNPPRPATGFRTRREYRVLNDTERNAFHRVLRTMKTNGEYDRFANLHQGGVATSAHGGPNFLGWHRVYLVLLEESMRRIDRTVSLPYWDSTLDFEMDNPANTILFSTEFLGNGFGFVTTGPFANWTTSEGQLRRNIGGASRLMTRNAINLILTRCRTSQISRPTATATYELELEHGGPHLWVGGQMRGLNTAAHDPIFFLHHAFIDNIWERFRVRQSSVCRPRRNPSRDYPPATGQHAQNRSMDGLPGYINIDGFRNYWTTTWYRYEPALSCPSCGASPYITCNTARNVCVSTARSVSLQDGSMGARLSLSPVETATSNNAAEARALDERLSVGPVFDAPPDEPRSQRAELASMAEAARVPNASRQKRAIP